MDDRSAMNYEGQYLGIPGRKKSRKGTDSSFLDRQRVDQQRDRRGNAHLGQNGQVVCFPGLMDDRRLWENCFCLLHDFQSADMKKFW